MIDLKDETFSLWPRHITPKLNYTLQYVLLTLLYIYKLYSLYAWMIE